MPGFRTRFKARHLLLRIGIKHIGFTAGAMLSVSQTYLALIKLGAVFTALLSFSSIARAQTWLPYERQLEVGVGTSFGYYDTTSTSDGNISGLPTYNSRTYLGIDYSPASRFLVTGLVHFAMDKFSGPQQGNNNSRIAHGSRDDGSVHFGVTDIELICRYQLFDELRFALTPFVRTRLPLTNYEVKGFAAAGSGLAEFSFGTNVGYFLTQRLAVEVSYMYSFVQRETGGGTATEQYNLDRSDMFLNVSYVMSNVFTLGARGDLHWTHGGFDFSDWNNVSSPVRDWHDPLLMRRYPVLGLFGSFALSDSTGFNVYAGQVVGGRNSSNTKIVALSFFWSTQL